MPIGSLVWFALPGSTKFALPDSTGMHRRKTRLIIAA